MEMLYTKNMLPAILAERSGYEGVRKIAGKVAADMEKVLGTAPFVVDEADLASRGLSADTAGIILCATLGKSPLLEELERKGLTDTGKLKGEDGSPKWEVYRIQRIFLEEGMVVAGLPRKVKQILLICGSDKRGTIYGMFSLSEYMGVSPLCDWGDAEPAFRESLQVGADIETVSKEPSVKYRGFFINDEWPCFGTWVTEHFGGFNADAYERVFELLLRLKGNYLWPAMWSASFPLDGPGSRNEELADLYGVVIGYSHHEPCLRASEEWDKVRGKDSAYGNEWNFHTNREGLLRYWEDGLKRSGKYEKMITIGMRGERDTSMLGAQSTRQENIELLKEIITEQRKIIRKYGTNKCSNRCGCGTEEGTPPLLLALYKEVEDFFYGDETTEGLREWDGLDGVTCMLCEDNFGNMRTLPTEKLRNRRGGFGMYYHLDYHGGPVSYEWVDSTPFSQIWEQMCMAYEYGIRDAWIVNAGDLKFHEVPLAYFLALAYDYDKWGSRNPDSYREYPLYWAEQNLPGAGREVQEKAAKVLADYIGLNFLRRPESLHPGVYHPCHYEETDRMLKRAEAVEKLSEEVLERLSAGEKDAWYSMVHYPALASMNLLKLHLYAGKNAHYAGQGRHAANSYAALASECIRRDRAFAEQFGSFRGGKWNGMQLAQHIGFTKWNEDGYQYPVLMQVEPVHKPRMKVSRKDGEEVYLKNYGSPMEIRVPDFLDAGCSRVILEIGNDGTGSLFYRISREPGMEKKESRKPEQCQADSREAKMSRTGSQEPEPCQLDALETEQCQTNSQTKGADMAGLPDWLQVTPMEGEVASLQEVVLTCIPDKLPVEKESVRLLIQDGDTTVAVLVEGKAAPVQSLPERTFLPRKGIVTMEASHFYRKRDVEKGAYTILEGYGKYGSGVKVFPYTASFGEADEKPALGYRFLAEKAGEYKVGIVVSPSNPTKAHTGLGLLLENSCGERRRLQLVEADFRAGDCGDARWTKGVLEQERTAWTRMYFEKGVQELWIGALEAGVVPERIYVCSPGASLLESYLGPEESFWVAKESNG